jgi:predicted O-methyltransferase YrrM
MMKLINRVIGYFGYEIRKRASLRSDKYDTYSGSTDIQEYFDKTEGMTSFEEAKLLYTLAREIRNSCIVEVGSYRGRSTVALGRGSLDGNKVPVYAIEPHEELTGVLGGKFGPPDRGAFYKAMLDTSCYHVVRLVNLSSEIVCSNWNKKIGLLWIDGDHTYKGVKRDFECWLPHLTPDAIIVFDDSTNPNLGPKQLVNELTGSNQFEKIQQIGKVTMIRRKQV